MAIKKQISPPPQPLHRVLVRWVLLLLKYPRRIAKRYGGYNGAIGEILHETGDKGLDNLRRRNSKLVNIFIYLPMFLGVMITLFLIYQNRSEFVLYLDKLTSPVYSTGFFNAIGAYFRRFYFIFSGFPLGLVELYGFIFGYVGSILGAWILSLNPAFKEQDKILHIFASLGHVDAEGKPWKVTWTPNAIMIESFNCDPFALCNNARFWSSVNFPPTTPKVFRNNMNKFIVQRKYELPSELIFESKGEHLG